MSEIISNGIVSILIVEKVVLSAFWIASIVKYDWSISNKSLIKSSGILFGLKFIDISVK